MIDRRKVDDRREKSRKTRNNKRKNLRRKDDIENKSSYYFVLIFIGVLITSLGILSFMYGYNL